MRSLLKTSIILAVFSFLKEIRPSEPFLYEFLTDTNDRRWRNLTKEEITYLVYPVPTFAYTTFLIIVFHCADLLKYKVVLFLLGACGAIMWSMLMWTSTFITLQIVQIFYGIFWACDNNYYPYVYNKIDKKDYQQVSTYIRITTVVGQVCSGAIAQIVISHNASNLRKLNYLSFAAMSAITIYSIFLPNVDKTLYFHREESTEHLLRKKVKSAFHLMFSHLKSAFKQRGIMKWSLWYILSTCGFLQVQRYIQPFWNSIKYEDEPLYNGATEAALALLAFLGSIKIGYARVNWDSKGEIFITVISIVQGFTLILASKSDVIVCYLCYIFFGYLYYALISITKSEIIKHIEETSIWWVFTFNTFMALIIQSFLTVLLVNGRVGFALSLRDQYFGYGCYYILLGVMFIFIKLGSVG